MTSKTKRLLLAACGVLALIIIAVAVYFLVFHYASTGGTSSPATESAAPSGPTPVPKILVIDRATILRQSAAGKDMIAQIDTLTKSAEAEFKGEDQRLRSDAAAFQQQSAVLAPEVRASRTREMQTRQQGLQKKVQDRQNQIQAGVYKARKLIEDTLGPILEQIMAERQANFLFDRNAVVLGTVDVDITGLAIQRLDQKVAKVKVELTDPASLGQAMPTQPPAPQ
jgi:Skp family chaperone for outer membrane proteins